MTNAKLFVKDGCPHCEAVDKPSQGVKIINVSDPDYAANGFVPNDIPMVQFGSVVLVGSKHINDYFNSAKLIL